MDDKLVTLVRRLEAKAGDVTGALKTTGGIEQAYARALAYAAVAQMLAGRAVTVGGPTIAEGIAVRDIGVLPIEVIRATVAGVSREDAAASIQKVLEDKMLLSVSRLLQRHRSRHLHVCR